MKALAGDVARSGVLISFIKNWQTFLKLNFTSNWRITRQFRLEPSLKAVQIQKTIQKSVTGTIPRDLDRLTLLMLYQNTFGNSVHRVSGRRHFWFHPWTRAVPQTWPRAWPLRRSHIVARRSVWISPAYLLCSGVFKAVENRTYTNG